MFIISVFIDAFFCPVTTIFVLLSIWTYIQIIHKLWNFEQFAITYHECIKKRQIFKLLLSSLSHATFIHLIFDVASLWSLRVLETCYGSYFFLRYTFLLILAESLTTLFIVYSISKISRASEVTLINTKFSGSSGVILCWLTYAALDSLTTDSLANVPYFYIFGFIPCIWIFVPMFMAVIIPVIANKHNPIANISGLLTGYLFYIGVLAMLPDTYWTICITFNIFLLFSSIIVNTPASVSTSQSPRSLFGEDDEVIEVVDLTVAEYLPIDEHSTDNGALVSDRRRRHSGDAEEAKAEEGRFSDSDRLVPMNIGSSSASSGGFAGAASGIASSFSRFANMINAVGGTRHRSTRPGGSRNGSGTTTPTRGLSIQMPTLSSSGTRPQYVGLSSQDQDSAISSEDSYMYDHHNSNTNTNINSNINSSARPMSRGNKPGPLNTNVKKDSDNDEEEV